MVGSVLFSRSVLLTAALNPGFFLPEGRIWFQLNPDPQPWKIIIKTIKDADFQGINISKIILLDCKIGREQKIPMINKNALFFFLLERGADYCLKIDISLFLGTQSEQICKYICRKRCEIVLKSAKLKFKFRKIFRFFFQYEDKSACIELSFIRCSRNNPWY